MNPITINSRVILFEYSRDGMISVSGHGTVLDPKNEKNIIILCDDGNIKAYDISMLQEYDDWED